MVPMSFFVILVPFSLLVSCVALGLSPFTFGVLCIWVGAASSLLAVLFHGAIVFLTLYRHRRYSHGYLSSATVDSGPLVSEKQQCSSSFSSPISSAALSPSLPPPVYSPSAHGQISHQCIAPRLSITIMIPKSQSNAASSRMVEVGSDILYNLLSIFTLIILTTLCLVAFGKTLDTTIRGAQSNAVLPAEREGTPFPWNKSIQRAQCGLLSMQLVLTLIVLIMSLKGKMEKEKRLKRLRDREEFMISP